MAVRLINAFLFLVILTGLVFAYRADRAYRKVLARYERLATKVGSFEVKDRSRLTVRAVETGEEMHFAWRVYIPAGMNFRWQSQGSASTFSSNGCELIVRTRLDENKDGILTLHTKTFDGQHKVQLGDSKLAELLRRRWREIQVEQLGSGSLAAVDTDEVATLLRLTLPDEMKLEAREKLDADLFRCVEEALVVIEVGSDSFPQAEASE